MGDAKSSKSRVGEVNMASVGPMSSENNIGDEW